ncbi:MAG: hypothetical protein K6B65_06615 [Bacilli bacterium]|nr:hypothetical protein [Bacilli bacterium]
MKNTQKRKNLLKIAAMTSMTVFSLLAVFTGTMAWFNASRVLNNGANQMEIGVTHNLQSIKIYPVVTANIEDGYEFSATPIQTITVNSPAPSISDWQYQEGGSSAVPYDSAEVVPMNPQVSNPTSSSGSSMVDDPFSPISPYHPLLMIIEYKDAVTVNATETVTVKMETNNNFLTLTISSSGQIQTVTLTVGDTTYTFRFNPTA